MKALFRTLGAIFLVSTQMTLGMGYVSWLWADKIAYAVNYADTIDWSSEEKIAKQDGNTCGFHAYKNGGFVYSFLTKQINLEQLNKRLITTYDWDHTFPLSAWQAMVGKDFDISDDNIYALNASVKRIPQNDLLVIPSIQQLGNTLKAENFRRTWHQPVRYIKHLQDTIKAIHTAIKTGTKVVKVFIVGDMREIENKGISGHWWTWVVSVENKKVTIYHLDSLYRKNTDYLALFKKLLIGTNLEELENQKQSLIKQTASDQEFARIRTALSNAIDANQFDRVLVNLSKISSIVDEKDISDYALGLLHPLVRLLEKINQQKIEKTTAENIINQIAGFFTNKAITELFQKAGTDDITLLDQFIKNSTNTVEKFEIFNSNFLSLITSIRNLHKHIEEKNRSSRNTANKLQIASSVAQMYNPQPVPTSVAPQPSQEASDIERQNQILITRMVQEQQDADLAHQLQQSEEIVAQKGFSEDETTTTSTSTSTQSQSEITWKECGICNTWRESTEFITCNSEPPHQTCIFCYGKMVQTIKNRSNKQGRIESNEVISCPYCRKDLDVTKL